MRTFRITLASLVVLGATGCAITQETRRSLDGYTQAMIQVDQSADRFLADFSSGLKAQEDLKRLEGVRPAALAQEYPDTLSLAVDAKAAQTPVGQKVAATRQALATVRTYNEALLALAEGKPENDIRQSATKLGDELQTLATLAGATLPALGPIIGIGSKIIKLAQDAANRKQLEQAIKEGSASVDLILRVLENQTPSMYELSVVGAKQAQDKSRDEIRRTGQVLKALIARHSPPANAELISKIPAQQALIGEIGRKTRTLEALPVPFKYSAGKPAYDTAADAEAAIFIESLGKSAQKYAEVIVRQNAYHDLMQKYAALLRATRNSLGVLVKSLSAPADLNAEVNRLLGAAFDLRDTMAAYRNIPATAP